MVGPAPPILFDITLKLSSHTLLYPGDPAPLVTRTSDLRQGDSLTTSHLSVSCHVGTHVDSPAHFIEHGATLDDLPLDSFYGPAVVVELVGKAVIEVADFTSVEIPTSHHILLKTDNSAFLKLDTFASSYCVLSPKAAEYLADLNPLSVGFDYYSLDPYQENGLHPAHTTLARANIPVFVCLDLGEIQPGGYLFAGFPLRLAGAEASPVRALLIANQ